MRTLTIFNCIVFLLLICAACSSEPREKSNDKEVEKQLSIADMNLSIGDFYERIVDVYDDGSPFIVEYYESETDVNPVFQRRYYRNGQVFIEGDLKNEQRHGKWVAFYTNGTIWSVGNYKNGVNHGESKVYYENGQLRYIKNYNMKTPHGLWEFYCPEGNLLGEIMFDDGEIEWEKNHMGDKNSFYFDESEVL